MTYYNFCYDLYGTQEDDGDNKKALGYNMGWPYFNEEQEGDDVLQEIDLINDCSHDYVNVGFYTINMACKYCGKEQE